jgi:hypothetical protein
VPPPDLSAHGPIRVGLSRNGYGVTFTGVWYWIECSTRLRDAGGPGLGMGWFGSVGRLGSKLFYGGVLWLTRNRPCLSLKYQIDSSLKSVRSHVLHEPENEVKCLAICGGIWMLSCADCFATSVEAKCREIAGSVYLLCFCSLCIHRK